MFRTIKPGPVEYKGVSTKPPVCNRPHLDSLEFLTDKGLADLLHASMEELQVRGGGISAMCRKCNTRLEFQNGGDLQCKCSHEKPNKASRKIPVELVTYP